mgnify:CR=1 FL=1
MAEQDWWRGSVTYQVYPRSFMDANGDGVGDLAGITEKLGHIADLGVDAVWLSPIFTSPMKDMGYDVSDYTGIDPVFGTLQDFDRLIAEAHRRGLKIIVDQVISHCSDRHPAFEESRVSRDNAKADWFVWADPHHDGTAPNNWQAIFGGIAWTWEPRRQQYFFHNFQRYQPDFNFHNPEVQAFHLDNMRFWLERGVDGFRLDTVNYYFHDRLLRDDPADFRPRPPGAIRPYDMQYHIFSKNQPENLEFLRKIRALMDEFDARVTVGEVGESHHPIEMMGAYTTGGRLNMAYSFEMLGPAFTPAHFRGQIERFFKGAPEGWPCWAFSNHDVVRHASRWEKHGTDAESVAKQAAAMLLSFEGSVCLYQGEELGQLDTVLAYEELTDPQGLAYWPEETGRDGCRTPMVWAKDAPHGGFTSGTPWLPVKDPQRAHAADSEIGGRVLSFYREMLRLRRETPELRSGRTRFLDLPDPLLGFLRGDGVLCVFNLSPDPVRAETGLAVTPLLAQAASIDGTAVDLGGSGLLIGRVG